MDENIKCINLFAESNAIEVANFCVYLDSPIDHADNRRFDESYENDIKNLYPAISSPDMLHIRIGNQRQDSSSTTPVPVKQLSHYRSDGRPDWTGSFGENRILVSCHFYDSWESVWPAAKKRLGLLLGCVDQYKNIFSIDYSVTDTFNAKSIDKSLVPSNLFKDNEFIAKYILESKDSRWDFSQGWFENPTTQDQILMRIEGQGGIENDVVIASIVNLYSQRPGTRIAVKDLLDSADGSSVIDQVFERFHDQNKDLLRKLLVDGLLNRMGLGE